jgi:hypothetical protein
MTTAVLFAKNHHRLGLRRASQAHPAALAAAFVQSPEGVEDHLVRTPTTTWWVSLAYIGVKFRARARHIGVLA